MEAMDIRVAFLQSKPIDREIHLERPKDIKKEGKILKVKKPLYGFHNDSRKWWLKVQGVLKKEGLKNVTGDQAFYFCHKNGVLIGMILTHVDDFDMVGTKAFLDRIKKVLMKELKISKIEKRKFRFTGIDVEKTENRVTVSMEDYAKSIEKIEDI
jgi:hypothetical protein